MEIKLNVFCLEDIEVQAQILLDMCDGRYTFKDIRKKVNKRGYIF